MDVMLNIDNIICILFLIVEIILCISKYDILDTIPIIISFIVYLFNKNEVYYILSVSLLVIFVTIFVIKKIIMMYKNKKNKLQNENKGVILNEK